MSNKKRHFIILVLLLPLLIGMDYGNTLNPIKVGLIKSVINNLLHSAVVSLDSGQDINLALNSNRKVILGPGIWDLASLGVIIPSSGAVPYNNLTIQGAGIGVTILQYKPGALPCSGV